MRRKSPLPYGWIILAVCFVAMVLSNGTHSSFSVFYVKILKEFGWTRASTASIFSVVVVTYGLTAPFVGTLVDRFGARKVLLIGGTILSLGMVFCSKVHTIYQFYLLFGLMTGIGTSLTGRPASTPVLLRWFPRRRGMALGILSAGSGIAFLTVPLVEYLIMKFGWRTSFILIGALIGAVLLPLVGFLFPRHSPDISLSSNTTYSLGKGDSGLDHPPGQIEGGDGWIHITWTLKKALGTYRLWLMFFTALCTFGFTEQLVVVHQVALMKDVGLTGTFVALLVALWGLMKAAGHLSAFISDYIGREKTFTLGCAFSILGLILLLLLEKGFQGWIPYLYPVFFGFGMGINGPVLGVTLSDLFWGKHFGSINGFTLLGFGLGGILGPWFGGFIFDHTGSYSQALMIAIVAVCLACIFLWLAAPRKVPRLT